MEELVLELLSHVVGWFGRNIFEVFALGFSGWALSRTFRTEKRDLIKERNDLLDLALKTGLTLTDVHLRAIELLVTRRSEYSEHQLKNLKLLYSGVQVTLRKIWEFHSKLKTPSPTAELLDSVSHPLREQVIFAAGSSRQFSKYYELKEQ